MKQNNVEFDEKKFQSLFTDEKLSPEQQLIKYGFVSGWLKGLFADKQVFEEYKANGKKFQDAYMEILKQDFEQFRQEVKL